MEVDFFLVVDVDFFFAVEGYDAEEILDLLASLGAPYAILDRTGYIMYEDLKNTGFTYTDPEIFRAIVAIGPTTSSEEFLDTLVHEIHHLAVAIAAELDIDLDSETPAYISGDSARALADVVCRLGCSHCRKYAS